VAGRRGKRQGEGEAGDKGGGREPGEKGKNDAAAWGLRAREMTAVGRWGGEGE